MAKLPSDESLGQMPGAAYSRPIATVDYSPETTGISNLGKGIEGLGGGIVTYAKEADRKAGVLDEARATSAYMTGKVKRDAELADLTDENAIEGHKKLYDENLNAAAAMIRDPQRREQFMLRYKPELARSHVSADNHWNKIDTDRTVAGMNESLDGIVQAAPKADEATRAQALKTVNKTIDDMVENQYITAVQGQALKKTWAQKYGEAAIGALPPSQRVAALAMPRDLSGSDVDRAMAILRDKEGFRSSTYWDVNHHRLGYGSDTITLPDGSVRTVRQGDSVTREDAERDLRRRTNDSLAQVRAAIGDEAFNKLSSNARAALASVAYNYGSLPSRVIPAAKSGDVNEVADAIERLQGDNNGVNRQRRLVEAAIARNGNVPGASVAGVIPENRRIDIINGANREMNLQQQQENLAAATEKATVNQLIQDDHSSILNTGTPMPDLTPERVGAALGPAKQQEFLQNREQAQRYHDATRDWSSIPASEIQARVETLKPAGGSAGFATQQKYYESAQKAAQTIIKAREADPAAAVNTFDEVKKAAQGVNANDPATVAALARARLKAQEVIGIPAANRMPITKQEAAALGKPIFNAPEGSATLDAIKTVLPFIDKAYGPYADKVLEFALTEAGLDDKVAKQAHSMMRKLQRGEPLTLADATEMQRAQTNAAQKEAAGGFDPFSGDVYSVPEKTPQVRTIPPSAITALRQNPAMIGDFMRKYGGDAYGQGAAAKAAEALGIKVPKAEK